METWNCSLIQFSTTNIKSLNFFSHLLVNLFSSCISHVYFLPAIFKYNQIIDINKFLYIIFFRILCNFIPHYCIQKRDKDGVLVNSYFHFNFFDRSPSTFTGVLIFLYISVMANTFLFSMPIKSLFLEYDQQLFSDYHTISFPAFYIFPTSAVI